MFRDRTGCASKKNTFIPGNSRLRSSATLINDEGVLIVGGCIGIAKNIQTQSKFPSILDGKHTYIRLFVQYYHEKAQHRSTEMIINKIRQRYWIVNL